MSPLRSDELKFTVEMVNVLQPVQQIEETWGQRDTYLIPISVMDRITTLYLHYTLQHS